MGRSLSSVTRLFCACFAAASALPVCASAQDNDDEVAQYAAAPPVLYPDGVRSLRDVTYGELYGFRPLTLDLYLPSSAVPAKPAVVFVHGGAFRRRTARDGGTFRDFPAVLASVAARGYVVASVNYRFVGEARFPAPVQDVGMAIRWLRTHAADYGIDTTRFVIWGSSAGGQIASVIGTACGVPVFEPPIGDGSQRLSAPPPSACVQGVIDWYGLIDLESNAADLGRADVPESRSRESAYLGCDVPKCPLGLARSASPLAYIDAHDPPFLIQHGTADTSVSPRQAQKLHDALRAAGVSSELVLYQGAEHGFAKAPGNGRDDALNRQALDKVFEFLGRHFPPKQ